MNYIEQYYQTLEEVKTDSNELTRLNNRLDELLAKLRITDGIKEVIDSIDKISK